MIENLAMVFGNGTKFVYSMQGRAKYLELLMLVLQRQESGTKC
jgi:hypothetical protein